MAHTIAQPGLHAHSWNPEEDLMKEFVVEKRIVKDGKAAGWLALASFDKYEDALDDLLDRKVSARIYSNKTDKVIYS